MPRFQTGIGAPFTPANNRSRVSAKPKAIDMFVGERLRLRRLELGLEQSDVARFIDVPPARIDAYERGTRRPDPEFLIDMAEVLGVTLRFFFI
jgi:ribosome-binding protein aMBF1 (putative translation factor)